MKNGYVIQENLGIKRILAVIKNSNHFQHRPLSVEARHSDALVYILYGSCTYRFDDGFEFVANKGDVFYLPYKSKYTMYIHTEDYRFIFCDFEFLETPVSPAIFEEKNLKNADALFIKLFNVYNSSSKYKYSESMSILYGIYNMLQHSGERAYIDKSIKTQLAAVKSYMDENYRNPDVTVPMLAERIDISEVYLRKLFKSEYGMSPLKYLNTVRLKNARRLMQYPFLSLEECAEQSGFSSLQYFCRKYKAEYGISPGKSRKRL